MPLKLILAILLALGISSCSVRNYREVRALQQTYPIAMNAWDGPVRRIAAPFASPRLEFSNDGRLVCACLHPGRDPRTGAGVPTRRAVYDLQSQEGLAAASAPAGFSMEAHFPQFSWSIPKASHQFRFYGWDNERLEELLLKDLPAPDLLRRAYSWRLSEDAREALLLTGRQRPEDWMEEQSRTIELWRLKPERKKLWSTELPQGMGQWLAAEFIERDGVGLALVVDRSAFYLLDRASGAIVSEHEYMENLSGEALEKRVALLAPGLRPEELGFQAVFRGGLADVNPRRRLLAVGVGFGRRVKVISLDAPFKTLYDLNALDDPRLWNQERIQFTGGHYLVVDYDYSRAGGRNFADAFDKTLFFRSTDIYDMRTGARVWRENRKSGDCGNLTLSPDGKRMAILRNGVIEIGEFAPQALAAARPAGNK